MSGEWVREGEESEECGVWSVECGAGSGEWGVGSGEWVGSGECGE